MRALKRAAAPGRVAATWYSGAQFDITVGLTDGQPHQVAFYCVDFDGRGRSQRMDVFDAATNALLDTRTISSFSGGTYVTWTITGSVRVRVTRLGGANAVVSGVFINAGAPGQSTTRSDTVDHYSSRRPRRDRSGRRQRHVSNRRRAASAPAESNRLALPMGWRGGSTDSDRCLRTGRRDPDWRRGNAQRRRRCVRHVSVRHVHFVFGACWRAAARVSASGR